MTLSFYAKAKYAICAFIWEEFMVIVEVSCKNNNYSLIGEHKKFCAYEDDIIF